ncbi:MAG TPA: bifunctional precorrin-2 dehydrogenase/sirohydrochlorin ferrochelatase [Bryobacteraceae bacterium]|nr:bifunctional precorrin-2 dehydrogenase/sirohydrochlorin ferrochelatase [Bryobacteraceae bacterium]
MTFRYPVVLGLEGKRCLVIGDAFGAEEKARGLGEHGAVVTRRPDYEEGCLEGFFLVIAATGDGALNARIAAEAGRMGILCNAVDDPPHCNFIFPAIHRQGDLTVAVSSGGKSPAVAARLRDRIAAGVGPEYGRLLELLGELRKELAARFPDFDERRRLWYRLADSEALSLLRDSRGDEAGRLVRELIERTPA